jgi:hypothetical protein
MDIVRETRENIVVTNNTAQESLIAILEQLTPDIKELIIDESLSGNVDFSILNTMGFNGIRKIVFAKKGQVTALWNLPQKLEVLHCNDQYLLDLENLPTSLLELNCSHNHIQSLDISKLNKLIILEISDNIFSELENIPESLQELYCNNNAIRNLNLREASSLKVLHISNNKTVIIENLPDSVVDFKSENNPYINIEYANGNSKKDGDSEEEIAQIDYMDALHDYFKMKTKYETNYLLQKKEAYEKGSTKKSKRKLVLRVIPKCINCNGVGGTLFENRDQIYYAKCSSKTPCNLNIQLENGLCYNTHSTLGIEKNELDQIKSKMIIQKLNNIFNYEKEEASIKLFKEYLEQYNYYNKEYLEMLEQYNTMYNDPIREVKIKAKQQQIYDIMDSIKELIEQYKKDGNSDLLKSAIDIQVKELNPELHNLQVLKYEVMEMDFRSQKGLLKTGGIQGGEEDQEESKTSSSSDEMVAVLTQRYSNIHKIQHCFGGNPKVLKYTK